VYNLKNQLFVGAWHAISLMAYFMPIFQIFQKTCKDVFYDETLSFSMINWAALKPSIVIYYIGVLAACLIMSNYYLLLSRSKYVYWISICISILWIIIIHPFGYIFGILVGLFFYSKKNEYINEHAKK